MFWVKYLRLHKTLLCCQLYFKGEKSSWMWVKIPPPEKRKSPIRCKHYMKKLYYNWWLDGEKNILWTNALCWSCSVKYLKMQNFLKINYIKNEATWSKLCCFVILLLDTIESDFAICLAFRCTGVRRVPPGGRSFQMRQSELVIIV